MALEEDSGYTCRLSILPCMQVPSSLFLAHLTYTLFVLESSLHLKLPIHPAEVEPDNLNHTITAAGSESPEVVCFHKH